METELLALVKSSVFSYQKNDKKSSKMDNQSCANLDNFSDMKNKKMGNND